MKNSLVLQFLQDKCYDNKTRWVEEAGKEVGSLEVS